MGSVGTARWVARGGSAAFALVLATALHGQPAAADRLDAAAIPARPAPADSLPIPILDATASAGERAILPDTDAAPAAVAVDGGEAALASWYGPGFYGNRTACGQTYGPELLGVAHRTLACGTLVAIARGAVQVVVPVIDRGPFVGGRSLDLSAATRAALGCPDLCAVRVQIVR
ncbi:MAG TPA: septal ring lytic transglycosylase RlpA family protein [Candidatus Limnocylindria bacterium]